MSKCLYLKFEQNTVTYHKTVTLGDVCEMYCTEAEIVSRLKAEKLYTFQAVRKGKKACAARNVFSVLEVIRLIQNKYPGLEIQTLGEDDFIVEYSTKLHEQFAWTALKVSFVCLVCFFGSVFSIMAFHEDVAIREIFSDLYLRLTGKESDGTTILELTYSLGLSLGILVFCNHMGERKLSKEPTPIEVEMRMYEEDVNKTLINTAGRSKQQKPLG